MKFGTGRGRASPWGAGYADGRKAGERASLASRGKLPG